MTGFLVVHLRVEILIFPGVILSEASRSFIVRGVVEGSAVATRVSAWRTPINA
jgi:hypothetical protein